MFSLNFASWDMPDDDEMLTPAEACRYLAISRAGLWRGVAAGYIPAPSYPLPRTPRFSRARLRAHLDNNQRLPREAREQRRRARLVAERVGPASPVE